MKMTENPMTGHPFFSGGFPGPIQGMQDRIHIQYWFDTESGVILKTRNQITTPDGRISVQEAVHRSIEIDPEFRDGYFSFEPDSGIVQVSQLTPPEILLHEQRLMDQKAPEFDLTDLHGKRVLMNEQHNKIVILNFWATWCGPCVQEIPMLNQLYKEYMDRGVVVLGISIDENVEVVQEFLEDHQVLYPVMLSNDEIESSYGPFRGIPTTFIIDRQGIVRKRILGYDGNPETLKEIIGDLL
jgi:peroxiredoxin